MHFSKQLGLACGLAQAGTGLGQTVMAPIISLVLARHSLAVLMYLFAGTFAISLPLCYLFKSVKREVSSEEDGKEDSTKSIKLIMAIFKTETFHDCWATS